MSLASAGPVLARVRVSVQVGTRVMRYLRWAVVEAMSAVREA